MSIVDPTDSLERQNEKLRIITQALMNRVEKSTDQSGLAYQQFERAALLENQVRERTSELERALDLLRESNCRLEVANSEAEAARTNLSEAIETINEGFALFDADDCLVLFNQRFCRDLKDVEAELVAGLKFLDYVMLVSKSRYLELPEAETCEKWAARRLTRHREAHVVFNLSLTQDRWLQISEHRAPRGGTVILQTDVTDIIRMERKERQKQRDAQAQMLQATLDHLNQGVCIFDREQVLVGWNQTMDRLLTMARGTSALGLEFATLLDRFKDELQFHSSFDEERFKKWAAQRGKRDPLSFEVGRGSSETLSVFAQDMPDRGFVISFTDVTAERAAARTLLEMNEVLEQHVLLRTEELGAALEEAERANASKSRFVAAASHDLLQPLSAAKLFVSSLADRVSDSDALQIVAKTEMALKGAEKIIEALLDISKLDAGRAAFKKQPIQLSEIFSPLRDELTPIAQEKGLILRLVECSLTVKSDPGYLRRIVQNLMANAIRYTDHGRVLVGVRRNGNSARIEVWDTGQGIAEEDQQSIFNEFERLGPYRPDQGLGLGLAIVERACAGLGHDLNVWSEPGKGSCFSVNVPINGIQLQTPMVELDAAAPKSQPLRGLMVMLVENDPTFSTALSLMIEELGADVLCAKDAAEAVNLLQAIQMMPDVFLFDYQLGHGLNGVELHQAIGQDFGIVPSAVVSANRTRELRQLCKEHGLKLLSKPISKEHLYMFLKTAQEDTIKTSPNFGEKVN